MVAQSAGNTNKIPVKTVDREKVLQIRLGDTEADYLSRSIGLIDTQQINLCTVCSD